MKEGGAEVGEREGMGRELWVGLGMKEQWLREEEEGPHPYPTQRTSIPFLSYERRKEPEGAR